MAKKKGIKVYSTSCKNTTSEHEQNMRRITRPIYCFIAYGNYTKRVSRVEAIIATQKGGTLTYTDDGDIIVDFNI